MGKANRLVLLLWKNWLMQKRKVAVTFFEIALPTIFSLVLIGIRQTVTSTKYDNSTLWAPFTIDNYNSTICSYGCKVYFTPNDNANAWKIMNRTQMSMNNITGIVGFATEDEMVARLVKEIGDMQYSLKSLLNNSTTKSTDNMVGLPLAGVVFSKLSSDLSTDPAVQYKLRFPARLRIAQLNGSNDDEAKKWRTQRVFPVFQRVGPRQKDKNTGGPPDYLNENFLPLQRAVDVSIIEEVQAASGGAAGPIGAPRDVDLELERTLYPPYVDDNFIMVIQQQLPMIIMLSFVFMAMQIVKDLVYEKETKLKESMKMMGLSGYLHWLAWFIKYFIFMLISTVLMTIFFKIKVGQKGRVINYTHPIIVLLFLLIYGMTTIIFCFMVSTFFSKANTAAAAGGIIFFITYIPFFFIQPRYDSMSTGAKVAVCLLSNCAMAMGAQVIGMFEGTGDGVQWKTLPDGVSVDDEFALLHVILMMLLDCVIYGLIAWYVEAVRPGDFGIPQPFYFPFTKNYWCGTGSSSHNSISPRSNGQENLGFANPALDEDIDGGDVSVPRGRESYFDSDPKQMRAGIRIRNLRKEFKVQGKKKVAVNDMILNMYEGQITALLGHNGAGKTTTMSMLTGFLPPTSGTAIVNGHDIMKDLSGVRSSLGLCPQHDVLFDTLTVEEHLIFFTKLKGMDTSEVQNEVNKMIQETGLEPKRDCESRTLSGGMKRKLCVGIALAASSKIVILDEPTSGMDPNARRQIWDLLQKNRSGRTMVLSTHFMDEADLLGDRIAIMAAGTVQCCGSSLFLKNKYGNELDILSLIVKQPDCRVEAITEMITKHVSGAFLESNVSAELSYVLPQEEKSAFSDLFSEMDRRRDELKIASCGVSVTTMEEVFLRVGKEAEESNLDNSNEDDDHKHIERNGHNPNQILGIKGKDGKNSGPVLYGQQFWGMFVKRAVHTARNWVLSLTQLLIPLLFVILSLIVLKTLPKAQDDPPLNLNLSDFQKLVVAYNSPQSPSAEQTQLLEGIKGSLSPYPLAQGVYINNQSDYKSNPDMNRFLTDAGLRSMSDYNNHYLVAMSLLSEGSITKAIAYFSNQAYHAIAISLNTFSNALIRAVTSKSNADISAINHPLPRTDYDKINDQLGWNYESFTIAFFLLFGIAFLGSSFTLFLIKERAVKSKHSQFVSGVHGITFWSSTFAWDFINFLIPMIGIIIAFAAFNIEAYVKGGRWGMVLLLFILFIFAMLPFMYLWSFAFSIPSTGLVRMTMFNIITGIGAVLAISILSIPSLGTANIAKVLEWVFTVFLPIFCLGQGMSNLYTNFQTMGVCMNAQIQTACQMLHLDNPCCKEYCTKDCIAYNTDYLGIEGLGMGKMLVFLTVQFIVYFFIIFLIEMNVFERMKYCCTDRTSKKKDENDDEYLSNGTNGVNGTHGANGTNGVNHASTERGWSPSGGTSPRGILLEDSDVATERRKIETSPIDALTQKNTLVMKNLTKVYDNGIVAVNKLCVGVEPGECFGLLGINGAGKTSTFQMLTGDSIITHGTAYLGGYNIKTDLRQIQRLIGYCPQFDALIDQMTVTETLYMYGRLRGVKEGELKTTSQNLMDLLALSPHANKQVRACSGGNKRKLSTAVALIGDPQIVFLDEPSTGVDPVARRHLWNVLAQVRDSGKTLVLTSHSMEECDALCTKICIMVNGQFKCLGSPQHLKNKFGEGYTLIIKISSADGQSLPDNRPVMDFVEKRFPGSTLKDSHEGLVHYQVTNPDVTLSSLFGTMEAERERLHIDDYSVSQTTLEQVFINFARAQTTPQEKREGFFSKCSPKRLCCCCNKKNEA